MACCQGLEPTLGGSYRANALGLGIQSQQPSPPHCNGGKATAEMTKSEEVSGAYGCDAVRVRGYEAANIAGFKAFAEDGQADGPDATMRVIRSCNGYAIGSAVCIRTGVPTGFLLKVSGSGHTVVTALRREFRNGDVYNLVYPRGIVVRDSTLVTIVGEGIFQGDKETFPAIAHVSISCSTEPVIIILGNENDSENSDSNSDSDSGCGGRQLRTHSTHRSEQYYDVIRNPANPSTVYIAGARHGIAAVFLVHDVHGIMRCVTNRPLQRKSVASTATCLTLTPSRMLVIGVQTRWSSSLLWTLAVDTLTDLHTGTATAFNDDCSKRLRLPEHCKTTDIIKVFTLPCGAVAAVATAWLATRRSNMPTSAVAVYRFTEDTLPDMRFGASGIVLWYDAHGTTTRPCDAVLHNDVIYVVGNAYGGGGEPGGSGHHACEPTYPNPCLPYLSVSATHSWPVPFLIGIRETGACCVLFTGLHGRAEGCFANTLTVTPGSLTVLTILGDVWFHLQCVGQPAGLLVVDIALLACPRILNNHYVSMPIINFGAAHGCTVIVDKLCSSTTLQVAGPVVVGKPLRSCADSIPGSIAFDPSTKTFLGFDGVSWKALAFYVREDDMTESESETATESESSR